MPEEFVWMCLYHNQIFETEDQVRSHEDKMECVAVLVPQKELDYYQLALENFMLKL